MKEHEYRGVKYQIDMDDYGQCYTVKFLDDRFGTEPIGLGTYNTDWQGAVEYMIDHELDYIGTVAPGAVLKYNYWGDIELTYGGRLVKVYLQEDWPEVNDALDLDARILVERININKKKEADE